MLLRDLVVDAGEFNARTGWAVKPEGACKGEVCVALPDSARAEDGRLEVRVLAEHLGMPLIHDEASGLWALGPETVTTGRALTTAVAPALTLDDVDGNPFQLSSVRGRKVVIVAWASW